MPNGGNGTKSVSPLLGLFCTRASVKTEDMTDYRNMRICHRSLDFARPLAQEYVAQWERQEARRRSCDVYLVFVRVTNLSTRRDDAFSLCFAFVNA